MKLVNIHQLKFLLGLFCVAFFSKAQAQETKAFASLQDVLAVVKEKNVSLQNAKLQTDLAILTKKTAIGNAINPRIPTSFQMIDNVDQQVSFLPGEAFGMPAGTFKEVTMGQQYVTTISIQPQFDIFNIANIAQIKSAKINHELVENQNKINEQKIYEQINALYFNILSFEAQKEIIKENIIVAERLIVVVKNKVNEGLVRQQELNEAEVNLVNLQDKLSQLDYNIAIQNQSLALFFENKITPKLEEKVWMYENQTEILKTQNDLLSKNADLQTRMAAQDLEISILQNIPTLSFVSSFNWQNLSNDIFFHENSNWVNFNYIGLKLSWDLPTTVQKLTTAKNKKIQLDILKNNAEHIQQEIETKNNQMSLELEKSIAQLQNLKKVYALKKDTYDKNFNQFIENILPLDKLLISQNDLLISQLNIVNSLTNIGFNKNKIIISNEF